MLVGFAAVSIVTSVVSGLTGAVAMPADAHLAPSSVAVDASGTARVSASPTSVGDAPASSGGTGSSAASAATGVLGSIQAVDPAALPGFLGAHTADLDRLLSAPPPAADVSTLWRLLDPARQKALLRAAPHVVGNLEGIPYAVRGKANALDLTRTMTHAREQLKTEHGKAERVSLKQRLTTLGNVEAALKKKDGVARTLVSLDTSENAKAAIVVGDLSTARYVSVLVPGMYMSVGEQIEAWAAVAQDIHDQETGFLTRFLGPRSSTAAPGVAVVAWIGYQTPMLMNIGGLQLAREGADSLERTLQGIQALRQDDPPYLSVFAHSYGSTAALLALERHTVTVDALALMGSPGSDAQSVRDLAVRGGNVFVGEAPMDPIVNSAFFGSDPGSPRYGAKPMGTQGAVDPITHRTLAGSSGHNEYFTAGTESVRNLALIGIDQGRLVLGSSGSSDTPETSTASAR
ncbi:alpha/beta hydrolase [Leifsonia sp. NPDC080035]|uniref:Alpha/beta hydrolase n=1 Tax=Leifsonia sp. NPDC080035 TaxID=3143936 RepID=A0AAU7GBX6_9MICO